LYLDEREARSGGQDNKEGSLFAGRTDVRGGREGFDFLGGNPRVGTVNVQRMDEMACGPFDEGVRIDGHRRGRPAIDMLEDGVEHGPCAPGKIGHERNEFTVEVAKKQQGFSLSTVKRE
jgi:hypothetical protein